MASTSNDDDDNDNNIYNTSSTPPEEALPEDEAVVTPDLVTFPARARASVHGGDSHGVLFETGHPVPTSELMGPLLRRKKVTSLPLGAGGDFFYTIDEEGPHQQVLHDYEMHHHPPHHHPPHHQPSSRPTRSKAKSLDPHRTGGAAAAVAASPETSPPPTAPGSPHVTPRRHRQTTPQHLFQGVLRRKQVSLDLLGPNDFFGVPADQSMQEGVEEEEERVEGKEVDEETGEVTTPGDKAPLETIDESGLFRPIRFAPRVQGRLGSGGHGHGGGGHGGPPPTTAASSASSSLDPETQEALQRYTQANSAVLQEMQKSLQGDDNKDMLEKLSPQIEKLKADEEVIRKSLRLGVTATIPETKMPDVQEEEMEPLKDEENFDTTSKETPTDYGIIRITRKDKVTGVILFLIMLALTLTVVLWKTHEGDNAFILTPVGLACVTTCLGNTTTRDFFHGHNHLSKGDVIHLIMHLDPQPEGHETKARVEIVGQESQIIKSTYEFGPAEADERISLKHDVTVDFENPHEPHVINVYSTKGNDVELSFTLLADVQNPLADHSVVIAAVIMIFVYLFILLEVIHRTLIAIFGSMVALMFYFAMQGGHTESIRIIMLNLEWSTLGLLFGMMLIVGELSHTGVFEWLAVRILLYSKGSYTRLVILLSVLTAVASAFLDNVTTMLLVAPVTIDMAHILEIDPRPYLIAEVLLSNIGGTATLIGDPPNLIIGSALSEYIGFVDFITNVLPCIFLFCVPAALGLVVWVYRWYFTSSKMRVLDTALLKRTYQIYDEPRLMISGIVTAFVILMFFLHPVHHKDTAWIALVGAFVCIAFTNPHDIQNALRNHVEWDTLLFFAGLFVLVEVCAAMGLLEAIGDALASYISGQDEDKQLTVAITLLMWVSAIASSFLDNIPYTATMIPVIKILADELPDTLPLQTLAWALSFGACLGGNGTLLGASANIVTAGISTNKGYDISFLNFLYPGMLVMVVTVAIANVYMLVRYSLV